MKIKGATLKELAFIISDYLGKNGVEVVLSGGACVSLYTQNKYMSYDLDFVLISSEAHKKTRDLLITIGFIENGRYFRHPDTEYFLDFLPSPLSVGEEPVKEINKIKRGKRILSLLSPTDCIKDRLAAYFYWDDRQSLEQAILVLKDQPADLAEVERWSKKEGNEDKFMLFLEKARKSIKKINT